MLNYQRVNTEMMEKDLDKQVEFLIGYFIGIENVIHWDYFFVMEKYGEN